MIARFLFERPWVLLAVWVGVELVLVGSWSFSRRRGAAQAAWCAFGALPILLILSTIVVTPTERIITLCEQLAASVDQGDIAAIAQAFDDEFEACGYDRTAFLERAERTLTRYRIDHARLRNFAVMVSAGDRATVEFNASGLVRSAEVGAQHLSSRWRLTLRARNNLWVLTKIESLPTPPLNVGDPCTWLW